MFNSSSFFPRKKERFDVSICAIFFYTRILFFNKLLFAKIKKELKSGKKDFI
jgi:hypothetical protein